MCVIASIPAGQTIDEQELRDMWSTNPDGGGIAYIKDGKVKVKKTMKLKTFLVVKNITEEHGHNDILMHMRIATHGEVCVQNVHPFNVRQDNKCVTIWYLHTTVSYLACFKPLLKMLDDGIQNQRHSSIQ